MFEQMKWEDVYELWRMCGYHFPKVLTEPVSAETVFVEYKQDGCYIYGYDWLEVTEAQERKHLIEKNPAQFLYLTKPKNLFEAVGIGGIINFIVPELNDFYSGFETKQEWRKNCYDLVRNDKAVYLILLKRFKTTCCNYPLYRKDCLLTSFNEKYNLWNKKKNKALFKEIKKL